MSDYGTMQSRIADELARSDLTTQIQRSIQSAIKFYERRRFYFNEAITTFSTVAAQEYYGTADNAEIPNIIEIDTLKLTANGSSYLLDPQDWQYIDEVSNSATASGDPTDYCYYRQEIRLYPIPDAVRTVTMSFVKRLPALPANGDTNAWMTDAEELIRIHAKRDLFVHVIRDFDEAAAMAEIEPEVLSVLDGETTKRISPGRLRPTLF